MNVEAAQLSTNQRPPPLATVLDVARHLSVSRGKVYQMMEAGQLPYARLGRCRRIAWKDVDAFVARSRVDAE
jgi:excisionase family DNA binding protein